MSRIIFPHFENLFGSKSEVRRSVCSDGESIKVKLLSFSSPHQSRIFHWPQQEAEKTVPVSSNVLNQLLFARIEYFSPEKLFVNLNQIE